ncbi:MAG TPA: chloride channel protein [Miltoncostaea sp.]|nr:chloride channel protein [Miltoncostaea sp.]
MVALSVPVGAAAAGVALLLLKGIGFLTNLLWHGIISTSLASPAGSGLGPVAILIPVAGGVVVGLMARFGSEGIRGHGIPEAMENILVRGSQVSPRLAVLKPVSSVVSIGTGGPFGAEGPIILTGGAVGSLVAQFFHFTASERKTLLVAGAAGGMSGVFATPVAATLLAVELLLFEWKPRSMVPAATAAAVAAAVRMRFSDAGLLSPAPLFPVPEHAILDERGLLSALVIGVACGLLAWVLTGAVYGAEDAFGRLPIHWAWWPAIGGVVVGVGGLINDRALGVGYDTLSDELAGRLTVTALVSLVLVKLVIWSVALGSGTSGGVLAPLLIMGAGVGGMLSPILAGASIGTWCVLGMASALAGVMRSPFTAIVFAFELTHDANVLLPLLIATTAAHAMSVLLLRRSILTEKVARKGVHVTREYAVDPLEALRVRDVMQTEVTTLRADTPVSEIRDAVAATPRRGDALLYPVMGPDGRMAGVVSWSDIVTAGEDGPVGELLRTEPVVAGRDETLRQAADRMAAHRIGVMPVVDEADPGILHGLVARADLFRAQMRMIEEERRRERVLRLRPLRPGDEEHPPRRAPEGERAVRR